MIFCVNNCINSFLSLYVNDVEYSYEINAQNGNIVSYEMDSIYD